MRLRICLGVHDTDCDEYAVFGSVFCEACLIEHEAACTRAGEAGEKCSTADIQIVNGKPVLVAVIPK